MADVATGPQGGPGVSAFGDSRAAGWLPWEEPPASHRGHVPHLSQAPHHLHLVEVRQTPPVDEYGPAPFVVTYFHPIVLMITFMGVGLQVPAGIFHAQAPLDPIVHFVVPMTTGPILFSYLFENYLLAALSTAVAIVTLGVCVEVGWEIVEFAGDHLFGLRWQVDNTDTMWDLIVGVAGALVGVLSHAAVRHAEEPG